MLFDLDDLREAACAFDHELDLADLVGDDGRALVPGGVRLVGRFEPGAKGVDLEARLGARLALSCSRCLEPFEEPLEVDLRLTIVGAATEFGGPEAEIRAEDADLYCAEGGRVDLRAIAREQIHLHLPLKPICGATCLGLCPSCGGNRNSIECGCRSAEVDPRLAPLQRLIERYRTIDGP